MKPGRELFTASGVWNSSGKRKMEESMMKVLILIAILLVAPLAEGADLLETLRPENIAGAHMILNPGGADIGFELEIAGDDPGLQDLVDLLRAAEAGGGHKCPNVGAIRFRMKDGSLVGIGLLPSHTAGLYEFRLYDGDKYLEAYILNRQDLLNALAPLGVPPDDPAFRE
jgi:hypothetical protein